MLAGFIGKGYLCAYWRTPISRPTPGSSAGSGSHLNNINRAEMTIYMNIVGLRYYALRDDRWQDLFDES